MTHKHFGEETVPVSPIISIIRKALVVVHSCNPSTLQAEAGNRVQGSVGPIQTPCLKKQKQIGWWFKLVILATGEAGSRDQEDCRSRPAWAKSWQEPISTNKNWAQCSASVIPAMQEA
jgi:hypothetical protein